MLVARPKFLPDESPSSLFLRAAELNGWRSVGAMLSICKPLAPTLLKALQNGSRFKEYAMLLGIEVPDQFGPYRSRRVGGQRGFELPSGVALPSTVLRPGGSVICPDCLCEDRPPYLRYSWQLKIFRTCPEHSCLLVESCEQCKGPLTWDRPAPHLCSCGFDLRCTTREVGSAEAATSTRALLLSEDDMRINIFVDKYCSYADVLDIHHDLEAQDQLLRDIHHDEQAALHKIKTHVVAGMDRLHPRLALLPILKIAHLKGIAKTLLREIGQQEIPPLAQDPPSGGITVDEAIEVLGISKTEILLRLYQEKILDTIHATANLSLTNASISCASCDKLLRVLWRNQSEEKDSTYSRPPTAPLLDFILKIIRSPLASAGYDLDKGLSSLRVSAVNYPEFQETSSTQNRRRESLRPKLVDYVSYDEAAEFLGVRKYVISSLIKTGWLSSIKDPFCHLSMLVNKRGLEAFNEEFICTAKLAKDLELNPTGTFVRKLHAAHFFPVGGDGIDGTKNLIFRRSDFSNKGTLAELRDFVSSRLPFQLKSPKDGLVALPQEETISLVDVMNELEISLPKVRTLVSRGFLLRRTSPALQVVVSKASFEAYRERWYDDNLMLVDDAARALFETHHQFCMRWVKPKLVRVHDLGIRRCIDVADLKRIQKIKSRYVLAPDCATMWMVGRFTLPNYENRGLIKARRMGLNGILRLYLRRDVERLLGPPRKGYSSVLVSPRAVDISGLYLG